MQFVLKIFKILLSPTTHRNKSLEQFWRLYAQNWANKFRLKISKILESNTTHTWHSLTESTFHNFRNFRNLRPLPFWDNQHPTKISNCAKPISTQNCFTARLKHKNLSQSYWQETMVVYWRMLLTPSNLFVQNLWFLLKRVYLKMTQPILVPLLAKLYYHIYFMVILIFPPETPPF